MPSTLAQLERLFWTTATGRLDTCAVRRELRSARGLDAVQRMAIYRDMYFGRQIEALQQDFPVLARELGDEAFRALSRRYVLRHPSRSPALEWLGRNLPAYLRELGFDPRLTDIASLEWLACAALLAPPDRVASPGGIAPSRWPGARLRFARSLQLAEVRRTAYLRYAGRPGRDDGRVVRIALFRCGFSVRHVELAVDECTALERARAGCAFTEICDALQDAARAFEVVRGWFGREWIAAVEVPAC